MQWNPGAANNHTQRARLVCDTESKKWIWADGSELDFKPSSNAYELALDRDCTTVFSWGIRSDGFWSCRNDHQAYTTDIFCTAPSRLPIPSNDGCESFEDDNDDGTCYQIGKTAENWQEAQMTCRSFGPDLASIHNLKENSFIRRLAVSKGALGGLYLGATISGKGKDFGWIDGSEWDYENFYPGFPIDGVGDCLVLDTEGSSGQWVNVDCNSKLSVACMRQQNYIAPACSAGPWKEGQIIYSPGFPLDASTPCDYILSVDSGKIIELELLLLEANPCCDHLTIIDNYFGGTLIANLTGEINDTIYTSNTSNFMRVSWQPTSGVNVRGMMMTFRGV